MNIILICPSTSIHYNMFENIYHTFMIYIFAAVNPVKIYISLEKHMVKIYFSTFIFFNFQDEPSVLVNEKRKEITAKVQCKRR